MNANELTVQEILDMMDYDFQHFHHNESSALAYDMLRQQQAEIEALKRKIAILDHCLNGAY